MTDHPRSTIARKTSTTTGLSYLSNDNAGNMPVRRVFVMVHGWGCRASHYNSLITALVDPAHAADDSILCIAPDLPGHGESPKSLAADPTMSFISTMIVKLCVEALAFAKHQKAAPPTELSLDVVLFGHSMGCRVALELFSQSPFSFGQVSSIILLDGSWYGPEPPPPFQPGGGEETKAHCLRHLDDFFGPQTSEDFRLEEHRQFERHDYEYISEMGWNYSTWDAFKAVEVLKSIPDRNRGSRPNNSHAEATPARLLLIQSMEGAGPTGRRSLKKGEETRWMKLVRDNVGAEWFNPYIVENTGHYPHIDNIDEVTSVLDQFLRASNQ